MHRYKRNCQKQKYKEKIVFEGGKYAQSFFTHKFLLGVDEAQYLHKNWDVLIVHLIVKYILPKFYKMKLIKKLIKYY